MFYTKGDGVGEGNNRLGENDRKPSYVINDLLAYLSALACLVTLGYQVYRWQQHDKWMGLPLFDLLEQLEWFHSWGWIHHPDSLLPLHNLVSYFLNFGLAAFFALIAAAFFAIGRRDR